MKTPKSKTISFRLPIDAADAIQERCEQTKQSPGEYVRSIVLDSLFERQTEAITEAIGSMNDSVNDLHELLSAQQVVLRRITFALLTRQETLTKQDAVAIVAQIFKTES